MALWPGKSPCKARGSGSWGSSWGMSPSSPSWDGHQRQVLAPGQRVEQRCQADRRIEPGAAGHDQFEGEQAALGHRPRRSRAETESGAGSMTSRGTPGQAGRGHWTALRFPAGAAGRPDHPAADRHVIHVRAKRRDARDRKSGLPSGREPRPADQPDVPSTPAAFSSASKRPAPTAAPRDHHRLASDAGRQVCASTRIGPLKPVSRTASA